MSGGGGITYLSGGVGGAKLALGLAKVLPAEDLAVIANTGDDFDHLGLRVDAVDVGQGGRGGEGGGEGGGGGGRALGEQHC